MVDLSFRKLLGHRIAWALALALLVAALWIPAGAQAATGTPGVPSAVTALPDVPAAAQATVGAALAQAGAGDVDRASVAAVPAPVPSVSSSPPPAPVPSASPPPAPAATPAITMPGRARRRPHVGLAGRLFADSRPGAAWWRAELVWRFPPPGRTRPPRRRGSRRAASATAMCAERNRPAAVVRSALRIEASAAASRSWRRTRSSSSAQSGRQPLAPDGPGSPGPVASPRRRSSWSPLIAHTSDSRTQPRRAPHLRQRPLNRSVRRRPLRCPRAGPGVPGPARAPAQPVRLRSRCSCSPA